MLNSLFWLALTLLVFSIAQDFNKSLISGLAPSISLLLFALSYYLYFRQIKSQNPIAKIDLKNLNKNQQTLLECDSNLINSQFQAVFNSALDAMLIINDEGKYIEVNPAACNLFGLSKEELIGRNFSEFTPANVDFSQAWCSFLEQGSVKAEFRLLCADGTVRDVEYSATANILPHRHLSILRDISERKNADCALQASEARIRLALEAADLGTWEVNLETSKVIGSERMKAMLGLNHTQFKEYMDSWNSQIHPDDLERVSAEFRNAIAGLSEYDTQYRVFWADGTIHWIASIGKVLCDVSGKPVLVIGVAMDITERKQGEVALRESEERFRRAVLNAPLPMILHAEDGEVLQINRTWTQITGYTQEEIPTIAAFTEKVYQQRPEFLKTDINRLYNFKQSIAQGEYTLITRQGERRIWDFYSAPLGELPDGRKLTISMALDITQRKQAEAEKQKLVDVVQNSVEFISFSSLEGQVLFMNPAGCKLMGIANLEEARNTSILEYLASEEISRFEMQILPALLREGQWQGELLLRHFQTGQTIATLFNTFIIKNIETGEPSFIGACCFDISPRKKAEEALKLAKEQLEIRVEERTAALVQVNQQLQYQLFERKRAENRLQEITSFQQAILDGANYTIISTTLDGTIVAFNAGAERLLGYTAAEVIGKTTPAIIHDPKEVVQRAQELSQELGMTIEPGFEVFVAKARRGHIEEREWTYIRKDGSTFPVLLSVTALRDTEGKITGFLGIGSDLTERKQAQEALVISEERFKSAFDYAAIGMALVGIDGSWLKVNRSLCEILGYSEQELLGMKFQQITHLEDLEADLNYVKQLIRGEIRSYEMEKRYIHKRGHLVWVLISVSMCVSSEGKPLYLIAQIQNISMRKQAQEALQESQGRLQAILDNATAIISLKDTKGRYLLINRQFERLFHITKEQILYGSTDYDIFPDETAEVFQANDRQVIQSGTSLEIEEIAPHDDGIHTYISIKFPLRDNTGVIYGVCTISTDITERKQAEEERTKLIDILEATSDFIASGNLDGSLNYLNSSARKIFGFAEDEDFANFTIPKTHPNWSYEIVRDQGIPAAIRDGVWVGETAFLSHNKQEIPVSQLIIAHKSADGHVKMLSTVARDITQQKQIEATLREAERRWRSLLENVRLVVVGLDTNGEIEYINPFFLELVGYTKEEVLSVDWFETFLPSHQKQGVQKKFIELLNEEFHKYNQNTILTKSGEERVIAWNNTLLRNLQGEAIGTLSIGEDITERQVIERMKDEFISVVSHELRTPLTSIHGALNLLASGLVDTQSDKGRRVIDIAAESAERLVRLVNDILELERLESGKISLLKQDCNADELIVKAIDMMQVMANRAGITLVTSTQTIPLNADPDRIIQVLTNLLGNAIKFSPKGSTIWLNVELQEAVHQERDETQDMGRNISPDSPYPLYLNNKSATLTPSDAQSPGRYPNPSPSLLLTVKDQGRGIPADKIETIFERFHQVDASDSRKKGGTGLGLAICRSIVQQHGGRIWVESTLGEGSSFCFTLPVADSGGEEL